MFSLQHRPFNLDDIAGHKAIINELKNRSKTLDFPQVTIFEGVSGSGKTTVALIIAGLLNCNNPVKNEDGSLSPCGKCESCQNIQKEVFNRDVMMLDASSMSKDKVLELQNVANTMPMYDKKRVIIIDEAQELSKAGKGAILKLLEQKRKHTHFILCTMDTTALDKAIKSRGQTYKFRPVNSIEIAEYLFKILEKENLVDTIPQEFLEKGIFLISEKANGNVREALQLLERVIYGEYYTEDKIIKELGVLSFSSNIDLILLLLQRDKRFFAKLNNDDILEFFRYSWKILINAKLYQITGYVKEKWQENSFKKLISFLSLDTLLKVYQNINNENQHYFNNNIFYYHLIQYYKLEDMPKVIRRPVRG